LYIPGIHENAGLGNRVGHLIEVVIDVVYDNKNLRLGLHLGPDFYAIIVATGLKVLGSTVEA
jgi:hypothetical protein